MSDDRDAIEPHDPATAQAQLTWVVQYCQGKRVLDAGCGRGRLAIPLAHAGVDVVAVDTDPQALQCVHDAAPSVQIIEATMDRCPVPVGSIDAVLCLGNTFALVHDVHEAVATMQHWRSMLKPGGTIVLDDLAGDLWPELAHGNWCSGVDEDGRQLVWAKDDAVFAVRSSVGGEDVDEADTKMRLWTSGALGLLALACGLEGPAVDAAGAVCVFSDPKNTGE